MRTLGAKTIMKNLVFSHSKSTQIALSCYPFGLESLVTPGQALLSPVIGSLSGKHAKNHPSQSAAFRNRLLPNHYRSFDF